MKKFWPGSFIALDADRTYHHLKRAARDAKKKHRGFCDLAAWVALNAYCDFNGKMPGEREATRLWHCGRDRARRFLARERRYVAPHLKPVERKQDGDKTHNPTTSEATFRATKKTEKQSKAEKHPTTNQTTKPTTKPATIPRLGSSDCMSKRSVLSFPSTLPVEATAQKIERAHENDLQKENREKAEWFMRLGKTPEERENGLRSHVRNRLVQAKCAPEEVDARTREHVEKIMQSVNAALQEAPR